MALIMTGLLFVVAAISLATSTDRVVVVPEPIGQPLVSRSLRFEDLSAGQVRVSDAVTGEELRVMQAGEGSFVRGVVRSFARARQQRGLSLTEPLLLERYADRLIVIDPLTQERIELGAFGATNSAEFSSLLAAAPDRRAF